MRRAAATLATALLATALSAPAAPAATPQTTLPLVERQVMCVTCKIPLNVAQSTQADRERAYIRELIAQGYGEAQIKQALVAQYGQTVLALPPSNGFDLAVYVVPVAVLAVLVTLLALLLPRWRRRPPAPSLGAAGAPAAPRLSQADRARLDEDLSRFD
jgi:cytochrome c-type biogenesis protein CcmH/NrfF